MDLVYQNTDQNIRVHYHQELNIIMIQFEGVIDHIEYQKAYQFFIELAHKTKCTQFVYHTKKIKKVSVRSRIWYLNHVFPKIFQENENMLTAIINAEHIGSQVATDTMRDALVEMGYHHLNVQRFDTLEKALVWLALRKTEITD